MADDVSTQVDQTILASDPKRPGNCVSACVASYLDIPLTAVPHFIETWPATTDGTEGSSDWWHALVGFMAGHGYWPHDLTPRGESPEPGEIVFAAGMSERGVMHQVLYRDGELWHDPHPSRAGVLEVTEVIAWRRVTFDHTPTGEAS